MIYEPAEDSYLLQKQVRKYAFGRILDLGSGSGIQALTAIESPNVKEIIAADINEEVIEHLNQEIKKNKIRKIKVVHSNLFENIHSKFNVIIFNPPYLPQDKGVKDLALYGGKKGWEISEKFFSQASKFLLPDGVILFLFSSLTNKDKIEEIIFNRMLNKEELDQQKLPFETLYVYKINKTPLLRELETHCLEEVSYFARGKRGIIYTAIQDKSRLIKTHFSKKDLVKVAIKTKREDSLAMERIRNEINWLNILNKKQIGPKFLFSGKNFLVYKFVEGKFILDWLKNKTSQEVKEVLFNILNQCFILDQLGVNKEEMHHPLKHILITEHNKPVLIDFERCSRTETPKNVTQFVEFISRIKNELENNNINIDADKLRDLAKEYKENYSQESLDNISKELK